MKCPNCQSYNEAGNRFCWNCGTDFSVVDEAQPPVFTPATPTDNEKQEIYEPTREEVVGKWQRQYEQEAREGRRKKSKFWLNNFRKALLATAIPIVILAVISAAGMALEQPSLLDSAFSVVWIAAVVLWAAALITAIFLIFLHKGEIVAGIFAGISIGIVALGLSCFSNMAFGL